MLLLSACLAAEGCATGAREKKMTLDLETTLTVENGETHVAAVLPEFRDGTRHDPPRTQLHRPFATLRDAQGRVLAGRDDRAMQGRRDYAQPPKTLPSPAGDAVPIVGFHSCPRLKRALAGPQSWSSRI